MKPNHKPNRITLSVYDRLGCIVELKEGFPATCPFLELHSADITTVTTDESTIDIANSSVAGKPTGMCLFPVPYPQELDPIQYPLTCPLEDARDNHQRFFNHPERIIERNGWIIPIHKGKANKAKAYKQEGWQCADQRERLIK